MEKKLVKVCAYCRVSTEKEEQKQSYEAQKKYFSSILTKERGYDLVDIYADRGTTGTSMNREDFQRMLYDAGLDKKEVKPTKGEIRNSKIKTVYFPSNREPKFTTIYVTNVSRFSRDTQIGAIIRALQDKGVGIFFEDIGANTMDFGSEVLINIMQVLAEQDSRDKSQKVRAGAAKSARNGKIRCGRELYGYTYNKEENTLRKVEEEAKIVRYIFNLRAEGKGGRQICNTLRAKGIKTRRGVDFRPHVVTRMLQNPTYCGLLVRNKYNCNNMFGKNTKVLNSKEDWIVEETNKVDKIIDRELFNEVQKLIDKSIQEIGSQKRGVYKERKQFSNCILCSKCGKYYTRNVNRLADGSKSYFYNCSTKKQYGTKRCNSKNVKEEDLEKILSYYMSKGVYKKEAKKLLDKAIELEKEKISTYIYVENNEEVSSIDKEIESYKVKLNKLTNLLLEDNSDTSLELFKRKKEDIDTEIKKLEQKRKELTQSKEDINRKIRIINKQVEGIKNLYSKIPEVITKEEFMDNYFYSFIVKEDGEVVLQTKAHLQFTLLIKFINEGILDEVLEGNILTLS
ncbi:recombinase family protein [Clostridium paraputrificum]|uniref:recombinase family protein n=1 Tax=Clostridium paraputrificum TaxID=29363 RepID=UPI00374F99C6